MNLCEAGSTDWWGMHMTSSLYAWQMGPDCANTMTLYKQFVDPAIFTCVKPKITSLYCIFLHNLQKFCILRVSVATCLRCDGKYYMSCWKLAFCSMLKEFWKSIRMWQSSRQSSAANFSSAILFGPLCIYIFISVFVCVCVCVNVVSWDHLTYSGDL